MIPRQPEAVQLRDAAGADIGVVGLASLTGTPYIAVYRGNAVMIDSWTAPWNSANEVRMHVVLSNGKSLLLLRATGIWLVDD